MGFLAAAGPSMMQMAPMAAGMMGSGGGGGEELSEDEKLRQEEAKQFALSQQERERSKAQRMAALAQLAGTSIPLQSSQFTAPIASPNAFGNLRNKLR